MTAHELGRGDDFNLGPSCSVVNILLFVFALGPSSSETCPMTRPAAAAAMTVPVPTSCDDEDDQLSRRNGHSRAGQQMGSRRRLEWRDTGNSEPVCLHLRVVFGTYTRHGLHLGCCVLSLRRTTAVGRKSGRKLEGQRDRNSHHWVITGLPFAIMSLWNAVHAPAV